MGSGEPADLNAVLDGIRPGSVVILGEQHNNGAHQGQKLTVLQGLRDRGLKVSVGMEFITYPFQSTCDLWLQGDLSLEDFLNEIEWSRGNPFQFYQAQMELPRAQVGEKLIMGEHVPNPEATKRYFTAQSTWDDTMAWKAQNFIVQNPDQVLVIVVGEFHVQYGGGLPDRLRARGVSRLHLFSLINLRDMSIDELRKQILPDPKYGKRSDYIWTSTY